MIESPLWGVYSVWRRHALLYRRTWLVNFLPPMTEPLFYLMSFGFGLSPVLSGFHLQGHDIPYLKFISPAMIAVGVCFQSFFEGAYGTFIRLRFQQVWTALLTAPISFGEIFVGDWLWAATRGTLAGIITGLVTVAIGQVTITALIGYLPLIILGSMVFGAVGMLVAGAVQSVDQINVPVFLFIIPMFTLCGTFFPRENLPLWLRSITGALPLANMIDLMRMPLGLKTNWPVELLSLTLWTGVAALGARHFIRPRVFR
ncbi:MAG: ABC transporter permease [Candidatus Sumerlaeaceae bacterium]